MRAMGLCSLLTALLAAATFFACSDDVDGVSPPAEDELRAGKQGSSCRSASECKAGLLCKTSSNGSRATCQLPGPGELGGFCDAVTWCEGRLVCDVAAHVCKETVAKNVPADVVEVAVPLLSLTVTPLTPQIANTLGVDPNRSGVVVLTVDPASDAARKGVSPGDVIVSADRIPVATGSDLAQLVTQSKSTGHTSVLLYVLRGGAGTFVPVSITN